MIFCRDCAFCSAASEGAYCQNPLISTPRTLGYVTGQPFYNISIQTDQLSANSVRDTNSMCGPTATWFTPQGEQACLT